MEKDPLARLFDSFVNCGQMQLKLANRLLALRTADADVKRLDEKLFKGGLDDLEKKSAESRFAAADELAGKTREEIKELVEHLTGVPLAMIEEANL